MNLSRVLGKHPTGVTRLPEGFNTADEHANVLPRNIRFPLSAIFMDFVRQKEKKRGGEEREEKERIFPSAPFPNGFLSSLHPGNFIAQRRHSRTTFMEN